MTNHVPLNKIGIYESTQIEIKRKFFLTVKCQLINEEITGLKTHHLATTNTTIDSSRRSVDAKDGDKSCSNNGT